LCTAKWDSSSVWAVESSLILSIWPQGHKPRRLIKSTTAPYLLPLSRAIFQCELPSLFDYITAPTAHPHFLTIFEGFLSHPYWKITTGTHQHDVGDVYLALTLNYPPLLGETTWPHMTLDHVDFFNNDPPFIDVDSKDFATLASVFTSNDLDEIILADMERTGNPLLHG
jgi:hypothetical protein